ncbi:MAG: hypothetical protein LCH77_01910 [Actinobacteria bacterium]|nr:hypothetical protein [Actinomycetota bacterium]
MIETLGVEVVVCFGRRGADFVRQQLGAHERIDSFVETNDRGWTSSTFVAGSGITVVQVTHPSRAHWRNRKADVSPLVSRALAPGQDLPLR